MPGVSRETATFENHGPVEDRHADIADTTVNFVTFRVDMDGRPLLKGLPDDRCSCRHWGYVFTGRVTFEFADHEETFEAGEAFYVPPGHAPIIAAGTEYLQFSPAEELRHVSKVLLANAREQQMIKA